MQGRLSTHNCECQHKLRAAVPKQICVTGNEVLQNNPRQNITYSEFLGKFPSTSFNLAQGFIMQFTLLSAWLWSSLIDQHYFFASFHFYTYVCLFIQQFSEGLYIISSCIDHCKLQECCMSLSFSPWSATLVSNQWRVQFIEQMGVDSQHCGCALK